VRSAPRPRSDPTCIAAGQLIVFGMGGKTRAVLLNPPVWQELAELLRPADLDPAVFRSRERGGALDWTRVHRMDKRAAERAGMSATVSAHWLRHAHVSHALDRGAAVHLVQATIGHMPPKSETNLKLFPARPFLNAGRALQFLLSAAEWTAPGCPKVAQGFPSSAAARSTTWNAGSRGC